MNFWLILIAYQAVWFLAVAGAGRGSWWPGVAGALAFLVARVATSAHRRVDLQLAVAALAIGLCLESLWVRSGLLNYAAPWPLAEAPAWIMALWLAFALTVIPLFGYMRTRPALAATLGAIGGPLAYLGAARGWQAVRFPVPTWPSLLALSAGWAVALTLLTSLARYWLHADAARSAP